MSSGGGSCWPPARMTRTSRVRHDRAARQRHETQALDAHIREAARELLVRQGVVSGAETVSSRSSSFRSASSSFHYYSSSAAAAPPSGSSRVTSSSRRSSPHLDCKPAAREPGVQFDAPKGSFRISRLAAPLPGTSAASTSATDASSVSEEAEEGLHAKGSPPMPRRTVGSSAPPRLALSLDALAAASSHGSSEEDGDGRLVDRLCRVHGQEYEATQLPPPTAEGEGRSGAGVLVPPKEEDTPPPTDAEAALLALDKGSVSPCTVDCSDVDDSVAPVPQTAGRREHWVSQAVMPRCETTFKAAPHFAGAQPEAGRSPRPPIGGDGLPTDSLCTERGLSPGAFRQRSTPERGLIPGSPLAPALQPKGPATLAPTAMEPQKRRRAAGPVHPTRKGRVARRIKRRSDEEEKKDAQRRQQRASFACGVVSGALLCTLIGGFAFFVSGARLLKK